MRSSSEAKNIRIEYYRMPERSRSMELELYLYIVFPRSYTAKRKSIQKQPKIQTTELGAYWSPTKRTICYCFPLIYLCFSLSMFIYFLYFQFLAYTNWSMRTAALHSLTAAATSYATAIYLRVGWDKCDMMLCVNGLIPAVGNTGCGGQPDVAQAFIVFAHYRSVSGKRKLRMRTTKKPKTNSSSHQRPKWRRVTLWRGQTAVYFVYCGI